jgi:hypothetical protein
MEITTLCSRVFPPHTGVQASRYVLDTYPCSFSLNVPGTASFVLPSSTSDLGLTEIQLDTLLHPIVDRGGVESLVAGTVDSFREYTRKATAMYKRAATDVSLPCHRLAALIIVY